MEGPNREILEHDWNIYLFRIGDVKDLTLEQVQRDGFEPHLNALYNGDLEEAKEDYIKLDEAAERGIKRALESDPLTRRVERYFRRRQEMEGSGIPIPPIEMESFSGPNYSQLSSWVEEIQSNLSDQERQVIESLFINPTTYTEIAERLGLSVNQVHELQQNTIEKMRLYARIRGMQYPKS